MALPPIMMFSNTEITFFDDFQHKGLQRAIVGGANSTSHAKLQSANGRV
jgi:hypothetical protein